ncbi:MAG: FecR domain-containing protein [Verrucomicrobiota bacterium]|nr:FecR domain-containing protein [Verrucomicrobiota bacterium]
MKRYSKFNLYHFLLLCSCLLSVVAYGQERLSDEQDPSKGAVIVVSVNGTAQTKEPEDEGLTSRVIPGSVLSEGDSLEVMTGGQVTLLLSNGTLLTVEQETKMIIGRFDQVPFELGEGEVEDLKEEPSVSNVEIDLEIGSLIVKTKKLSRNSSFDINSPVGTAGIRGTEFQLGVDPSKGMQLDVTESTVAFTPPGGSPVPISQGQGLDVSRAGAMSTRPVAPVVAQKITVTNDSATKASGKVKLESVSRAMKTSTVKAKKRREARKSSNKSRKQEQETKEAETEEQAPEKEAELIESSNEKKETSSEKNSGGSEQGSKKSNQPRTEMKRGSEKPKIDEILEADQDAKQTRKSGKKAAASASQLARFGMDESELEKFYTFPDSVQAAMAKEPTSVVRRLLEMEELTPVLAENFMSYSKRARGKLLALDDPMLVSLLEDQVEEEIILDVLSAGSIQNASVENLPDPIETSPLDQEILVLGDKLRESGNLAVFEEVEELNGGSWNDEWVAIAEVGNELSKSYYFLSDWNSLQAFEASQALNNPFFDEVSSLYDQLMLDSMDVGMSPAVVGGKSIEIGPESYNFSEMLGDSMGLLIGATEKLKIRGVIEIGAESSSGSSVGLVSGGAIEVSTGTNLKSTLSDMIVSAREDVLLNETTLESVREVAVRSLRDLQIEQLTINAPDRVHLRASRNLDVNGLELSQSLPRLIMEATTIRLSNIDFPSATSVQLNSLKGAIDGRYPNFGSGVSLEQQLGRVNFIENVRSGGNLMYNRTSFDQFGGNISIGKLANP